MTVLDMPRDSQGAAASYAHKEHIDVVICNDPTLPIWAAAADVEAQVFIEKGYVRTKHELTEEYAPYLGQSAMIALLRNGEEVPGATRVIRYHKDRGFKTLNDAKAGRLVLSAEGQQIIDGLDMHRTLEAGTASLLSDFRASHGKKYAGILYGALYDHAVGQGVDNIIAAFDAEYFKGFSRRFGILTTPLGPPTDYMGSLTVPAYMNVTKASPEMFR